MTDGNEVQFPQGEVGLSPGNENPQQEHVVNPVENEEVKLPEKEEKKVPNKSVVTLVILVLFVLVAAGVYIGYRYIAQSSTTGKPNGVIYLGPSNEQKTPTAPLRFAIAPNTSWMTYKGKIYPFTFSYPATLTLVTFVNDPTDAVAISWGNIPPQLNVLLTVDSLSSNLTMNPYINRPKIEYVQNWWKQYSGLKSVATVVEFTNSLGMRGYKAKYVNYAGETPNDNIFFEVPGRTDLIVMLANGILDPSVFDRIVDSLSWQEAEAATSTPTVAPVLELTPTP